MVEKQASSEIAQSRERFLDEISKQMGDAGYCNYAACRTFLARAMDEAERDTREHCAQQLEELASKSPSDSEKHHLRRGAERIRGKE